MKEEHLPSKSLLGNLGEDHGAKAKRTDWETPQLLYDFLNEEFQFTLDPCSNGDNAKCAKYYTPLDDGLFQSWASERAFMNCPYGPAINEWVKKAYSETNNECILVVGLLPVRGSNAWFHDYVINKAEIRFVRGRITFVGGGGGAAFSSMITVWKNKRHFPDFIPTISTLDLKRIDVGQLELTGFEGFKDE